MYFPRDLYLVFSWDVHKHMPKLHHCRRTTKIRFQGVTPDHGVGPTVFRHGPRADIENKPAVATYGRLGRYYSLSGVSYSLYRGRHGRGWGRHQCENFKWPRSFIRVWCTNKVEYIQIVTRCCRSKSSSRKCASLMAQKYSFESRENGTGQNIGNARALRW